MKMIHILNSFDKELDNYLSDWLSNDNNRNPAVAFITASCKEVQS